MYRHFEHVGMATADMDACLHFYIDLMGLRLVVRRTAPDGTEVAFVDATGAMLEIVSPPGISRVPARAVPSTEPGLRHLTFTVDSVDEAYAHLLASGVTGLEPPRDARNRDILARVAFVADPDGIVVELAQRPSV